MSKEMPKCPPQFLSYCPSRSYSTGGDWKCHETLGKAKQAVSYHNYGNIYQWDNGWILIYEVPQPDWRVYPRKRVDWDACKV